MAGVAKTWYATNTLVSVHQELSETSPGSNATSSPAVGWVVGTGATNHSELDAGNTRASSTFTGTTVPDGSPDTTLGDCLRTSTVYSGSFASANWTVDFAVIGVTQSGAQDGRMRCRLLRGTNANGSGATEVTAAQQQGGLVTNLSTTQQISTATFNPGAFTVSDEYLFIQIAWERTGAGGMTTTDVIMRVGTTATRVVSAAFTPSLPPAGIATGYASGTARLVLYARPTGLSTAEAHGTQKLVPRISPTGIASAYASGTALMKHKVTPSGLTSAEAHGTQAMRLYARPSGLSSAGAFGAHTVALDDALATPLTYYGAKTAHFWYQDFGYFTPLDVADLALKGYWREYGGAPWESTASAGDSGESDREFDHANAPGTSTLNSKGVADFNGTNHQLATASAVGDFMVPASGYSYEVLFLARSLTAKAANIYQNPQLICDSGGYWGVAIYDDPSFPGFVALVAWHYDSTTATFKETQPRYWVLDVWVLVQVDFNEVTKVLMTRLIGGGWTAQTVDAVSTVGVVRMGVNYAQAAFFDGKIAYASIGPKRTVRGHDRVVEWTHSEWDYMEDLVHGPRNKRWHDEVGEADLIDGRSTIASPQTGTTPAGSLEIIFEEGDGATIEVDQVSGREPIRLTAAPAGTKAAQFGGAFYVGTLDDNFYVIWNAGSWGIYVFNGVFTLFVPDDTIEVPLTPNTYYTFTVDVRSDPGPEKMIVYLNGVEVGSSDPGAPGDFVSDLEQGDFLYINIDTAPVDATLKVLAYFMAFDTEDFALDTDAEAVAQILQNLIVAAQSIDLDTNAIGSGEAHGTQKLNFKAYPTGIATAFAAGTQQLNLKAFPTALASAETHGSTRTVLYARPPGVAGAEAFGTQKLNQTTAPTGIATAFAAGALRLVLYARPSGLAGAEAFGSATLIPGVVTASPTGIASGYASGTQRLVLYARPTGLASGFVSGTAQLNFKAYPSAIASAFVSGTAVTRLYARPTALDTAYASGSHTLSTGLVLVSPIGIASAFASGNHALLPGVVTITCSGIASAFVSGTVTFTLYARPTGVGSGAALGSARVVIHISPAGVASGEALGSTRLNFRVLFIGLPSAFVSGDATAFQQGFLTPTGLPSAFVSGAPTLIPGAVSVSPSGLASVFAAGTALVTRTLSVTGIASAYASGSATIVPGVATVVAVAVAGAEAFGTARLNLYARITGISSAETFGVVTLTSRAFVVPVAVASGFAAGTHRLSFTLHAVGVASAGAVRAPRTVVYARPTGVASVEAFGTYRVKHPEQAIAVQALASAFASGTATLLAGGVTLTIASIASSEQIGTHVMRRGEFIDPLGIPSAAVFGTQAVAAWANPVVSYSGVAVTPGPVRPHGSGVIE